MSTGAKIGISFGAAFAVGIAFMIGSYFSYSNTAVAFETNIETAVDNNRQKLGQYRLGTAEAVGALGLGSDLQAESVTAQIEARYGEGGSQAMMQWITENNHAGVGPEAIQTIMRKITAGRQGFSDAQERLLDVCRGYKALQRQPYSGAWLRIAGYPSDEYSAEGGNGTLCRAVTSKGAKKAFETGEEEQMDIRSGKPEA
jgi:hypothetical protein